MIVVLTGKIGSGKSTISRILKEKYNFEEMAFSDPLKEFGLSVGFTKNQLYGSQKEKEEVNDFWGMSGRKFMQTFGTDIMRNQKYIEKFWIRALEKRLSNKNIVITDGRFSDEIEMIRKHGGMVVKIERDNNRYKNNLHSSETELDNIIPDYIICNNGTLEELEISLKTTMNI
jgi:energy-coupling factor transporter ATP-binding protein EcfA2